VSIKIFFPPVSINNEQRVLLFLGLSELQTEQPQPIIGTPVDVAQPSIMTLIKPNLALSYYHCKVNPKIKIQKIFSRSKNNGLQIGKNII
jgi:hypothetical protein